MLAMNVLSRRSLLRARFAWHLLLSVSTLGCGRIGFQHVADTSRGPSPDAAADGMTDARSDDAAADGMADASDAGGSAPRCTRVEPLWATAISSPGGESIRRLDVGPDGTLFVGGHFSSPITVGGTSLTSTGETDLFVAAFALDGSVRWARALGGPLEDELNVLDIASTGGELLVGGTARERIVLDGEEHILHPRGTGFAVVLDASNGQWKRDVVLQSGGDTALSGGSLAPDGRAVLTGWFWRPTEVLGASISPAGRLDAFLFGLDATWSTAWGRAAGTAGWDRGDDVEWSADGGILWGGRFDRSIDFGGGTRTPPDDSRDGFFVVRLAPDRAFSWDWTGWQRPSATMSRLRIGLDGTIFLAGKTGGRSTWGRETETPAAGPMPSWSRWTRWEEPNGDASSERNETTRSWGSIRYPGEAPWPWDVSAETSTLETGGRTRSQEGPGAA